MCKLLIMTGIQDGTIAEEFMKRMAVPMSKRNTDGLGYTAVGPDGKLFAERWHQNWQSFSTKHIMTPKVAEILKPYANRLPAGALNTNYSRLGKVNFAEMKSVTMHTRYATCGTEFANTHPFIDQDTSLIHNGSISNAFSTEHRKGLDVNKLSTCDSEAALQTYLNEGVKDDSSKAKGWLDLLSGGWAFGILSRNPQGNRILDVVRGTSMLYYMEIDGLGKVFTTDDDDAKSVVKDMNLTFLNAPQLVQYNTMYRFDALTGELLENVDIKPAYVPTTYGSGWRQWGSEDSKTKGGTGDGTSAPRNVESTRKRIGERLFTLVEGIKDDPVAMQLLPDIFTTKSTVDRLDVDFRKVKLLCNDQREPLIDRLEVFDMVFNRNYVGIYEGLPPELKQFVHECDRTEDARAVRQLLDSIVEEKKHSM